jgi:ABC-type transporter Mla MlaB component
MPRESALPFVDDGPEASALTFAVEQQNRVVWVTLSGILDRAGLARLVRRVAPGLAAPGSRIVLDGRRLAHVDFRAVRHLVRWQRHLGARRHRIELTGWSDYLRAILSMEDWQGELVSRGTYRSSWRVIEGVKQTRQP